MPKKILLADDSITIQKVIAITFAAEDYELVIVGDGDSAIDRIKAVKPDLVMVDVAMPGKTGYQVCDYIKRDPALKNIPVILLSGTFEPLNREEAERVKADGNIAKPFESQELIDRVKDFLSKAEAAREAAGRPPIESVPLLEEGAVLEKHPESPLEIWEAGDFIGFSEEFDKKQAAEEPSIDFLDGGLFEAPSAEELSVPEPGEFMDLSFEEEKQPRAERLEKEESFPSIDIGAFETEEPGPEPLLNEPLKVEPIELMPSHKDEMSEEAVQDIQPMAEEAEPEDLPWFSPPGKQAESAVAPEIKAVVEEVPEETDLLEAPSELIEENTPEERAGSAAEEAVRPEVEERLVEEVAGRAEEKIRGDLTGRISAGVTLPKEQIEEIVQRVAREVIEEIAWEVVPDIAEDLIKAEINRVKEALKRPSK